MYSFRKIINFVLVIISYLISCIIKKNIVWGFPFRISVELTNLCNLQCAECVTGSGGMKRKSGFIDYKLFTQIIKQISRFVIRLTLNFQGESFLHPNLFEIIKFAHINNIHTNISTNAHFLNLENARLTVASGLDSLIISIDGMCNQTYKKYRKNGDIELVLEGIKNIMEEKKASKSKTPHITLQFLVFKHNEHEIEAFIKFAKHSLVDNYVIKTAQIINTGSFETMLPRNAKYSRYAKKNSEFMLKSELPNRCFRLWAAAVITWDGRFLPCCFDKNADNEYGNLNDSLYSEIWQSTKAKQFRCKILTNRKAIAMCNNCDSGLKRLLYRKKGSK